MEIRVNTHQRHIAIVTIAHEARRNAMTRAMMADLAALWDRLDADHNCRAVIVTGAGDRSFCVGADISGDLCASAAMAHVINRALLKDTPFTKPIIAAVNGDCVGGGVELLLSTDIRAAVPAARFGLPEVRWSIYPFGGATVKLAQQVGHVHAMDLLLTGRLVDAGFAEKIGLINTIVEPERLMPWAIETAEAIAANSPAAVQAVKEQISTAAPMFAAARRLSRIRRPRARQPPFRRRRRRVPRETEAELFVSPIGRVAALPLFASRWIDPRAHAFERWLMNR